MQDPHAGRPYAAYISIIKLAYLWLDYVLGYWLVLVHDLAKDGMVIFDRYYDDLLVDPRRYRYGGPMWLARLVSHLIPRPHLAILFDAPPNVIHTRKQEVDLDETVRQCNEYKALVRRLPAAEVIDASRPLDLVMEQVERTILRYAIMRGPSNHQCDA